MADLHWDHPRSRWPLLRKHLDQAVERDAPIIIPGDFFCAMQGKFDPRHRKGDVRPEHDVRNYFDALTETAVDWFAPYAHQLAVIAPGNHERSILKHNEVDLIHRFVTGLNITHGVTCQEGRYRGWVFFRLEHDGGGHRSSKKLFYHHGRVGGKVTRGVNHSLYRAAENPDADAVVTGDSHSAYIIPVERVRVSGAGTEEVDIQWAIQLPSYKEEWISDDGFAVEKSHGPRINGCVWLRFICEDGRNVALQAIPDFYGFRPGEA